MNRGTTIVLVLVGIVVLGLVIWVGYKAVGGGLETGASGEGWSSGSGVKMNDKMIAFMDDLAEKTGIYLFVTDGVRTAADQAAALATKVELGETMEELYALYVRDDLIAELAEAPVEAWPDIIEAQIDRGDYLSSHMSGEALDLRTSGGGAGATGQLSTGEVNAVAAAAGELGARAVNEDTPPHLHLEIGDYTELVV